MDQILAFMLGDGLRQIGWPINETMNVREHQVGKLLRDGLFGILISNLIFFLTMHLISIRFEPSRPLKLF